MIYFDWWIQHHSVKPYLKKFAAYYYNRAAEWGIEVAINYKHDAFLFGAAVPDVEQRTVCGHEIVYLADGYGGGFEFLVLYREQ